MAGAGENRRNPALIAGTVFHHGVAVLALTTYQENDIMGAIACVTGATGLVGGEVVDLLCRDADFDAVHLMTRRVTPAMHPKTISHIIDFDQVEKVDWPSCDVLFCCLGTTIKSAGSEQAFRKVDFDYVIQSARRARLAGASTLIVISAMGAAQRSKVFYNRTKGDMEAAVASLGFARVIIVRPSLLAGARTESRPAERLGLAAMTLVNFVIPKKYRSVPARAVARAMVALAKDRVAGVRIVESDRLQEFAA